MDTYTRRPRRLSIFRRAGWLAVVSMVALSLAGPSASSAFATETGTVSSISVGSCFDGSAGMSGTLTISGPLPATFSIWVTDHVPPGKGGDGMWHVIPGSVQTITATTSPYPFGPLSIVGGQANANSYRVQQSSSNAKSASISPCGTTPPTGSLTITKTVVGAGAWAGGTFTFSVTCTDPIYSTTATINTATGTTATVTGIPLSLEESNSCTVAETDMAAVPAGHTPWVTTYSPLGGITPVGAQAPGAVTVTNSTSQAPECSDGLFTYSASGSQPYPMLSVTVRVTAGVTLSSDCSRSFSLNSYETQGQTWATSGTQTLLDHQSTTLDATHMGPVTLTVESPTCYGQTDFYRGLTRFDGTSGNGALPHYPDSNVPTGLLAYSNGGTACQSPSAHLTLVKVVNNAAGGEASASAWTLAAAGTTPISGHTGDPAITNATVTPGSYTLSESGSPANYSPSSWVCVGGTQDGASISLAADQSATCTITNTYTYTPPNPPVLQFGTLVIVKNTVGGNGTFSFTGTGTGVSPSFDLTTSGRTASQTFSGLTPGSGYAVSEAAASGWAQTSASCTGEGNTPAHVTIIGGGAVTCTFTNTKNTPPPPPTGGVAGATGTPGHGVAGATGKPHITPPPTSALGSVPARPAGDTWRIALLGLAALLASLLVFSPKTSPERRRR